MALSNYDPGQELSSINFSAMIGGPLSAAVNAQNQAALATVDFIKSIGFSPDTVDPDTEEITPGTPVYVTFKYPKMVAPYVPKGLGDVTSATVHNGGTGYVTGEILTLGGGGGTVSISSVDTGKITGVTVLSKGSGYTNDSIITPDGGSGSGAKIKIFAADTEAVPAEFAQMLLEVPILTIVPIPYLRIDFVEIDFNAKITSMEFREFGNKFQISSGFASKTDVNAGGSAEGKLGPIRIGGSASVTSSVEFKVNASYQSNVKGGFKIDKTYQLGIKVRASQDEMPGGLERILGILEDAIVAQPVIE
ncbi:MAG TPA: DUF2589 domain-containing protein [Ferruginibacter sp.]|nr:DUF2589 domain-containing protein [Ferruginibacter sp.]HMP22471.1 DUF2589 domain-containing protein [Ferruginibacter sp.]